MSTGWIKLHRELLSWEWYDDINTKCLFIHCLLRANHSDTEWRGHKIKRGQFLTSVDTLTRETGLSVSQIRTSLKKLISTNELASKSQARSTVITVVKYDSHQDSDKPDSKLMTMKSQADDNEIATDKNLRTKEPNKDTVNSALKIEGFSHWWSTYPKKTAKPDAEKAFKAKTKNMSDDDFMQFVDLISNDSIKRYKETEKQFISNPAKYIRQELYNDE